MNSTTFSILVRCAIGILLVASLPLPGFSQGAGAGTATADIFNDGAPAEAVTLAAGMPAFGELAMLEPDDQDDPAYGLYKEGYALILDENWSDAVKKFERLLKQYPHSDHREGAEYWTAHALMHFDRKRSRELYHKFLKDYPDSKFSDDAIADLEQLNAKSFTVSATGGDSVSVFVHGNGNGYAFTTAPRALAIDKSMRAFERQMRRLKLAPIPGLRWSGSAEEPEDPETRLKLEALEAIGEMNEDDKSYETLRDIALDSGQPRRMRAAAMDGLSRFTKHDVVGVYLEIARRDTSEDVQTLAIDYISQVPTDKKRSVDVLVELFKVVPESREEQQQSVLYSIAEIGNDRAIDFLVTVARGHKKYDLRSDAVYLLGNIGGEKARSALYEILRGK